MDPTSLFTDQGILGGVVVVLLGTCGVLFRMLQKANDDRIEDMKTLAVGSIKTNEAASSALRDMSDAVKALTVELQRAR